MNKFITGKELEDAIYNIIWEANNTLVIVSPYIKLDDYFKNLFKKHINNPDLHILIVFGKNEKEVRRSMGSADFDFFKEFMNVSIVHMPNLHGKYYANDREGIVTSINLYDYSFKNNIEFGVHSYQEGFVDRFKANIDDEAFKIAMEVANEGRVIYIKRPVYDVKRILFKNIKNYIKSDVLYDITKNILRVFGNSLNNTEFKRLEDFPEELILGETFEIMPEREVEENPDYGYCIRTGKRIKYNIKQPFSYDAWKVWNEYGNKNFPEKYCHKTGKLSNGKTSFQNPVL